MSQIVSSCRIWPSYVLNMHSHYISYLIIIFYALYFLPMDDFICHVFVFSYIFIIS